MSARRRSIALVGVTAPLLALAWAGISSAQKFEPRKPRTVVVGAPRAFATTDRVDGQRTALTRAPLPRGPLRIAWRRPLALTIDRAPLVPLSGDVLVVGSRGDVVTLDGDDGSEKLRVGAGPLGTAAATLTSDGTLVFLTPLGEAVGVRGAQIRYRTRIGSERGVSTRVSPLPLDDGGVIVAAGAELAALDADGAIRARRTLPEAAVVPLVDARGMAIAIAASGVAYGWAPDREPQRVGSFGGPVDEGAAFDGVRSLIAVIANRQLVALDLDRGIATTRTAPTTGLLLGPPALSSGLTHVFLHGSASTLAVAYDAAGQEAWTARVATFVPTLSADGGVATVIAPAHDGALVDASGALAFATPSGFVGVVSGCGAPHRGDDAGDGRCVVDVLGEAPCARGIVEGRAPTGVPSAQAGPRLSSGIAGLAPAGPGAFVVACEGGTVLKITGRAPRDERD